MLELAFSAVAGAHGQFYYEAITTELEELEIAETWHTNFTRKLVEKTEPDTP